MIQFFTLQKTLRKVTEQKIEVSVCGAGQAPECDEREREGEGERESIGSEGDGRVSIVALLRPRHERAEVMHATTPSWR